MDAVAPRQRTGDVALDERLGPATLGLEQHVRALVLDQVLIRDAVLPRGRATVAKALLGLRERGAAPPKQRLDPDAVESVRLGERHAVLRRPVEPHELMTHPGEGGVAPRRGQGVGRALGTVAVAIGADLGDEPGPQQARDGVVHRAVGERHQAVVAAGDTAPSGVDRQASLLLQTDAGAQAFLHASWTAPTPRLAEITGEHGSLELPSPFWEAPEVVLRGVDRVVRDVWADPRRWAPREAMSFEAAAVARYVAEGRTESPLHPLDRAVRDIGVVERARAAIVGS